MGRKHEYVVSGRINRSLWRILVTALSTIVAVLLVLIVVFAWNMVILAIQTWSQS